MLKDEAHSSGLIYPILNNIFNNLKYINCVELFKFIAKKITPKNASESIKVRYLRNSVDIYILLKWTILFVAVIWKIQSIFFTYLIWYLLVVNLYTYFFYHVWSDSILTDEVITLVRMKRRFSNLCLSYVYSILGFSYLFYIPYETKFYWSKSEPTFIKSIIYSISNSFTAGYSIVQPVSDFGVGLSTIQLVMSFIFLSIVIVVSIPQMSSIEKKENY